MITIKTSRINHVNVLVEINFVVTKNSNASYPVIFLKQQLHYKAIKENNGIFITVMSCVSRVLCNKNPPTSMQVN